MRKPLYYQSNSRYRSVISVQHHRPTHMTLTKKKVLIVDDQESVLLIESRLAKFAGYEPLTASDGDEALKLIRSHAVDLILLDLMLPGTSGFEVLRELREDPKTKDIPVIVITALDNKHDASLQGLAGVAEILSKPVPTKKLQDILKQYLGPATEISS